MMSGAQARHAMASGPCPLLLVCGDTAGQRRQLLARAHLQLTSQRAASRILVLDLAGSPPATACPSTGPETRWQLYRREAWAEQIWQQLLPVLEPWSDLLEGALPAHEPPPSREIPGFDALLSCLYLADQCAQAAVAEADALILLLAPLEQSLPMLQLACRGPDLLEGLWRPLLLWWSQARQRLAQVELLLRLRLPAAETLELSSRWRDCLDQLAQRLSAPSVEVLLALAAEREDLASLGARVVSLPLSGLPRLRLWLDADLPPADAEQLRRQLTVPLLVGPSPCFRRQASSWLASALPPETQLWESHEAVQRCRLYLPGLVREGLQVQRQKQIVQIRSGGLRLSVPLPADWSQLECRSARLESPWLVIDFA
jgi:hypothetical protein